MCGRYVSASAPDELAAYFGADATSESLIEGSRAGEPNHNVAPTQTVPVVVHRNEQRTIDAFRWGLVPFWAKDLKIGSRMINARAETVATKNSFRSPFKKRRCIIPADGFYEWAVVGKTDKGKPVKQPVFIHRVDGAPFALGGLWDTWTAPDDADEAELLGLEAQQKVRTCTIITGSPNSAVKNIHDRMPIMLPPSAWEQWLDPELQDPDVISEFLVPAPSELLTMYAVSTNVNNTRNNGPELTDEVEAPPGLVLA